MTAPYGSIFDGLQSYNVVNANGDEMRVAALDDSHEGQLREDAILAAKLLNLGRLLLTRDERSALGGSGVVTDADALTAVINRMPELREPIGMAVLVDEQTRRANELRNAASKAAGRVSLATDDTHTEVLRRRAAEISAEADLAEASLAITLKDHRVPGFLASPDQMTVSHDSDNPSAAAPHFAEPSLTTISATIEGNA